MLKANKRKQILEEVQDAWSVYVTMSEQRRGQVPKQDADFIFWTRRLSVMGKVASDEAKGELQLLFLCVVIWGRCEQGERPFAFKLLGSVSVAVISCYLGTMESIDFSGLIIGSGRYRLLQRRSEWRRIEIVSDANGDCFSYVCPSTRVIHRDRGQ